MSLKQTGAPSVEPVTTTTQKTFMRVDSSDEDTLIGNLAASARALFEDSTNRQCITATWQLKLTNWPTAEIVLPVSPLQSVTSVTYVDQDGDTQTWSTGDYDVFTASTPGRIRPKYDKDWPSDSRGGHDEITITFVAGYGDAATDVPDGILTCIHLVASSWYENREATQPVALTVMPLAVKSLMQQYRDGTVEASA